MKIGIARNVYPPRVHRVEDGAVDDPTRRWQRDHDTEQLGRPHFVDEHRWIARELDSFVWRENVTLLSRDRHRSATFWRCYDHRMVIVDRYHWLPRRPSAWWAARKAIARENGYRWFGVNRKTGAVAGSLARLAERSRSWDRTA